MCPSISLPDVRKQSLAHLDHHPRVGVEQALAGDASQHRPRIHGSFVGEGVLQHEFLFALAPAARASKLSVEALQGVPLRKQFVFIALDCLPNQFGVHLKVRHCQHIPQANRRSIDGRCNCD